MPIIVALEGKKVLADNFEYITGRWTLVKEFNFGLFEPVWFKKCAKLNLGFGSVNKFDNLNSLFYTIDLSTYNVVVEVIGEENAPALFTGGFSTSSGYFGGGSIDLIIHSESEREFVPNKEFW